MTPQERTAAARRRAQELGFSWFATAGAAFLEQDLERLRRWLADGFHGSMRWMEREPEQRADPRRVLEGCRSVIVVGVNYLRPQSWGRRTRSIVPRPPTLDDPNLPVPVPPRDNRPESSRGKVSRYARSRDYHRVIEIRLRKLCREMEDSEGNAYRTASMVDYGPVLERAWAVRGGLGFIGKNSLLIHPQEGSYHFLGVILTTAELAPTPHEVPMTDCGDCTRCIEACPTDAITEPGRVDARRCLSYLTIEHEGAIDEALWPQFDGWLFGCDVCQDVCPYNQKRARPAPPDSLLGPSIVQANPRLVDWLRVTDEDIAAMPLATPLRRAGADRLARNAAIVAASQGGAAEREVLAELATDESRPDWLRDTAARAATLLAEKRG